MRVIIGKHYVRDLLLFRKKACGLVCPCKIEINPAAERFHIVSVGIAVFSIDKKLLHGFRRAGINPVRIADINLGTPFSHVMGRHGLIGNPHLLGAHGITGTP